MTVRLYLWYLPPRADIARFLPTQDDEVALVDHIVHARAHASAVFARAGSPVGGSKAPIALRERQIERLMESHKSLIAAGPFARAQRARSPAPREASPLRPPPEEEVKYYTSPYNQYMVRPLAPTPTDAPRIDTHAFQRSVRYHRPPSPAAKAGGRRAWGESPTRRLKHDADHGSVHLAASVTASVTASGAASPRAPANSAPGSPSSSRPGSPRSSPRGPPSTGSPGPAAESPRLTQSWRGDGEHTSDEPKDQAKEGTDSAARPPPVIVEDPPVYHAPGDEADPASAGTGRAAPCSCSGSGSEVLSSPPAVTGSPDRPDSSSPKKRFSLLEGTSSVAVGGTSPLIYEQAAAPVIAARSPARSPRGSPRSASPSPRRKSPASSPGKSGASTAMRTSSSPTYRSPTELNNEPKSMWRRAWQPPKRTYGDDEGDGAAEIMNEAARVRALDQKMEREKGSQMKDNDVKKEKVPKAHMAVSVMAV